MGNWGQRPGPMPGNGRLREVLPLSCRDLAKTVGILLAASLIGLLFYHAGITEANIVTMYLLAVLCTALATNGRLYGILASVASVLVFNYLFTVPRFTFKFNDVSRYSVTFLVMFIAACITSTLTMRVKAQARQATRKAYRSELLLKTSQALQRAEGEAQILCVAAEHLSKLLRASVLLYPVAGGALQEPLFCPFGADGRPRFASPADQRAAAAVLEHGGQAPRRRVPVHGGGCGGAPPRGGGGGGAARPFPGRLRPQPHGSSAERVRTGAGKGAHRP